MRTLAVFLLALCAAPGVARAGDNDLVLSRLGQVNAAGDDVIPNNQDFRSLVSELGVIIAPKFLSPSDTLGYSGFQFSSELAFTGINNDAGYWCATEETAGCTAADRKGSGLVGTWGVLASKGIWFPLPSFEVGAGFHNVLDSHMWAGMAYAKFGLHEGFHDWPIPSVAARGDVSRLFGEPELDLTVASFDVSISKSFGVQGTVNLSPYAGWNVLWIVPRSQVVDKSPHVDAFESSTDLRMNFVFPDQDNIVRQRVFGGIKAKYYVFALTAEVNFAFAGSSIDDRSGAQRCDDVGPEAQASCDAQDKSDAQQTYALSLSVDF